MLRAPSAATSNTNAASSSNNNSAANTASSSIPADGQLANVITTHVDTPDVTEVVVTPINENRSSEVAYKYYN